MRFSACKWVAALGLSAILALAVMACGGGEGSISESESSPLRIGVMESLTGPGETYGTVAVRAKQMAADEINAAGGINGRMLELVIEDSKCSAQDAIAAYHKLTDVDEMKIILGTSCSGAMLGVGTARRRRRGGLVLRSGQQPRHRQRGRLHLPDSDQRYRGGYQHRQRSVGGRRPQAGHHYRRDRLRRGCSAHLCSSVRGKRRRQLLPKSDTRPTSPISGRN